MAGPPRAVDSEGTLAPRAAALLFLLGSLAEMTVGVAGILFPEILAFLMAAPLDPSGLIVARMLGCAVLALGITWWFARRDAALLSRYAAGFLIYNAGVGLAFALAALASARPALPWLVCVAHLLLAAGFGAAMAATPRVAPNDAVKS